MLDHSTLLQICYGFVLRSLKLAAIWQNVVPHFAINDNITIALVSFVIILLHFSIFPAFVIKQLLCVLLFCYP